MGSGGRSEVAPNDEALIRLQHLGRDLGVDRIKRTAGRGSGSCNTAPIPCR